MPPLWFGTHTRVWDRWERTVAVLYIVASAFAYAALLISRRRSNEGLGVIAARRTALLSLACLTVLLARLPIDDSAGDRWGRAIGVAAVLTVAATLVTLILQRLEAPARSEAHSAGGVAGRTIVSVEQRESETILVLDDGTRLPLAPGAILDLD
jgi:hypothetical protein